MIPIRIGDHVRRKDHRGSEMIVILLEHGVACCEWTLWQNLTPEFTSTMALFPVADLERIPGAFRRVPDAD